MSPPTTILESEGIDVELDSEPKSEEDDSSADVFKYDGSNRADANPVDEACPSASCHFILNYISNKVKVSMP